MENGLPQNSVQALAQTRDGFLWIGTESGLVRFDGVAFQVFDRNSTPSLPGNDIRCLLEANDGALWVGTNAGLARWKDGVVTTFTTQNGLPDNGILSLSQKNDGQFRVWTEKGEARLTEGRFVPATDADGFPHTALPSPWESPEAAVFEDRLQNQVLVHGSRRTVSIFEGRKISGASSQLRIGRELPGSRIQAVLGDREDSFWIGTNAGLVRWVRGKVERLPVTDPLAAASILALFEDREGDLWVGTEDEGLHILRDQRFHTISSREGLSSNQITAVVQDQAGTLWVGTQQDGLNAIRERRPALGEDTRTDIGGPWDAGAVQTYSVRNGLASNVILSLAGAPSGDLWVGTPDGLSRIRGTSVATFTSADGLPDDFIRSLLVDGDGSLWIGTRRGLTHWINANRGATAPLQLKTYTQADGLGSDLVGAMTRDAEGDLWVATLAGLARVHSGAIVNFTARDGLSNSIVTSLLPRADGTLLVGTQDHGWNLWDGRRFTAMSGGLDKTSIYGILDDGRGHLWFATGNGIARCDDLGTRNMSPAPSCANLILFGTADGLPSREAATNSHPAAWRSDRGALWFATPEGLVEADPAHFPTNAIPPPVALERFAVDDADEPLNMKSGLVKVAAGHVRFQFDYAALSFVTPQKVRYRYKLEGFDKDWTDADARRSAFYTNIPPGRYTFHVQAANNDGIWNTAGTSFSFELDRHWYQAIWFYALLLAVMALLILLLIQRRLRHAEVEFRAVLGERSRIAREIHDTLAQGYVGVSVQLEVLGHLLRTHKLDEAEKHLAQTREIVREGLADARQSIWALRTQDASETTLPVRLRRTVEGAGSDGLEAQFSIYGAYRPLPATSEQELLRIVQEAIHNVKKHAGASMVAVQLRYSAEEIVLEIRDNGHGWAQDQNGEPPSVGFGLMGMRERAANLGGTLEVSSGHGEGTTVRLRAPAGRDQAKGAR